MSIIKILTISICILTINTVRAEIINFNDQLIIDRDKFNAAYSFGNSCIIYFNSNYTVQVDIPCRQVFNILNRER
jgi:hypothetical protein